MIDRVKTNTGTRWPAAGPGKKQSDGSPLMCEKQVTRLLLRRDKPNFGLATDSHRFCSTGSTTKKPERCGDSSDGEHQNWGAMMKTPVPPSTRAHGLLE